MTITNPAAQTPGPDHLSTAPALVGEVVTAPTLFAPFAAAAVQVAITLLGAFVLIPLDNFTTWEAGVPAALGLLIIALGAVGTYIAPLLGANESGWLKVAIPIAAGIIAAFIDFWTAGDFSITAIGFLVLSVLNGLSAHIGVQARKRGEVAVAA